MITFSPGSARISGYFRDGRRSDYDQATSFFSIKRNSMLIMWRYVSGLCISTYTVLAIVRFLSKVSQYL